MEATTDYKMDKIALIFSKHTFVFSFDNILYIAILTKDTINNELLIKQVDNNFVIFNSNNKEQTSIAGELIFQNLLKYKITNFNNIAK